MKLTPLGSEFESVIAATILFLFGGALSFLCCFAVTHVYLCYKRRIYRKRRRHDKEDRENSSYMILDEDSLYTPSEVVVQKTPKHDHSRHSHKNREAGVARSNTISVGQNGRKGTVPAEIQSASSSTDSTNTA